MPQLRSPKLRVQPNSQNYGDAVRANHRGWIVLDSVASPDNLFCVDLFEDPAGGFGFELLRTDPEDGGRWTAVGGYASTRFESVEHARRSAADAVRWFPAN